MKCDFADSLLQCYFDGELSGRRAAEFERHLQRCDLCATLLVNLDWLSGALRLTQLYVPAPASVRRTIHDHFRPSEPAAAPSQPLLWHWMAAAAALLILGIALWIASPGLRSDDYQAEFAGEIVELYMRSLQPGDTAGISSKDERIIKEWFDANLKFAFPVRDFTEAGFALKGGSVDVVEGRSVAVLAYEHNGRPINLFIWPTRERDTPPREGSRQGLQWIEWRKSRLEFCAVSGADPADLDELNRLMAD